MTQRRRGARGTERARGRPQVFTGSAASAREEILESEPNAPAKSGTPTPTAKGNPQLFKFNHLPPL